MNRREVFSNLAGSLAGFFGFTSVTHRSEQDDLVTYQVYRLSGEPLPGITIEDKDENLILDAELSIKVPKRLGMPREVFLVDRNIRGQA